MKSKVKMKSKVATVSLFLRCISQFVMEGRHKRSVWESNKLGIHSAVGSQKCIMKSKKPTVRQKNPMNKSSCDRQKTQKECKGNIAHGREICRWESETYDEEQ